MTVEDRLTEIAASGMPLAYDGCHEIYFLPTQETESEARDFGYDIYPSSYIHRIFAESCHWRFVHLWALLEVPEAWEHEWNIEQFEVEGDFDKL